MIYHKDLLTLAILVRSFIFQDVLEIWVSGREWILCDPNLLKSTTYLERFTILSPLVFPYSGRSVCVTKFTYLQPMIVRMMGSKFYILLSRNIWVCTRLGMCVA